jgi:hypothetical protein
LTLRVAKIAQILQQQITGVVMAGIEWKIGCALKPTKKICVVLNGTKKAKYPFLSGVLF